MVVYEELREELRGNFIVVSFFVWFSFADRIFQITNLVRMFGPFDGVR